MNNAHCFPSPHHFQTSLCAAILEPQFPHRRDYLLFSIPNHHPQNPDEPMKTLQEIEQALSHSPEVANPPGPFYSGAEAPCRFEAEVYHCVVRGRIPPEIDGTYYRCMPDALWAPLYDDDVCVPASLLSPP